MSVDTPLWLLAANALLGVVLIVWMMLTLLPFLVGAAPLLPGMDIAFLSACAWAGWNTRLILKNSKEPHHGG